MDTRGNANRNNNRAVPNGANAAGGNDATVMGVVRTMLENQQRQSETQQQQITLLREALLAAQQTSAAAQVTATAAVERMTAPREPRTKNITDFMRMNPAVFTGTETPLEDEQ